MYVCIYSFIYIVMNLWIYVFKLLSVLIDHIYISNRSEYIFLMVLSWSLFRICYNDMTIDSPCSWFLSMTFTPTVFAIPDVYPSDCPLNSLREAFGLIKEHGYCRTSTKAFKPSGQCVLLHHFQITHVNTRPFSKKLSRPWWISLTTTTTKLKSFTTAPTNILHYH